VDSYESFGVCFHDEDFAFCQMMHSLGHEVFHYGVEGSEVDDCTVEHVQIMSWTEQEGFFGEYDPDVLYEVIQAFQGMT